jgi:hypothetical protein
VSSKKALEVLAGSKVVKLLEEKSYQGGFSSGSIVHSRATA